MLQELLNNPKPIFLIKLFGTWLKGTVIVLSVIKIVGEQTFYFRRIAWQFDGLICIWQKYKYMINCI